MRLAEFFNQPLRRQRNQASAKGFFSYRNDRRRVFNPVDPHLSFSAAPFRVVVKALLTLLAARATAAAYILRTAFFRGMRQHSEYLLRRIIITLFPVGRDVYTLAVFSDRNRLRVTRFEKYV